MQRTFNSFELDPSHPCTFPTNIQHLNLRRLSLAMLERAIIDASAQRKDALEWITNIDIGGITFRECAETLEMEGEHLQTAVLNYLARHIAVRPNAYFGYSKREVFGRRKKGHYSREITRVA